MKKMRNHVNHCGAAGEAALKAHFGKFGDHCPLKRFVLYKTTAGWVKVTTTAKSYVARKA